MTTDELWQQFFFHLQARRRTPATLRYYANTQTVFGRYVEAHGLPQDAAALTVQHLRAFLRQLEADGLAPGGVHAHARALRALLTWAFKEELLSVNPVKRLEMPRVDRRRLPAVSGPQVQQLLKLCRKGPQPLRDCAVVLVLFDTGIRVQESGQPATGRPAVRARAAAHSRQGQQGALRAHRGPGHAGPERLPAPRAPSRPRRGAQRLSWSRRPAADQERDRHPPAQAGPVPRACRAPTAHPTPSGAALPWSSCATAATCSRCSRSWATAAWR